MKNLQNLGKILNREQLKQINGGKVVCCYSNPICPPYHQVACLVLGNVCHYFPGQGTSC